jgi:hypothetical protein
MELLRKRPLDITSVLVIFYFFDLILDLMNTSAENIDFFGVIKHFVWKDQVVGF